MATKLTYFNINGVAEFIRFILHYKGEKFEDIRHKREDWPIKEVKDALPYGQMPVYEEGDRKINQSLAIARYLGHKYDLLPSDPWEQAELDAAALNVYEFCKETIIKLRDVKTPEGKKATIDEILKKDVPFYLSRFERDLKVNNGHFGKELSWADFVLVGMMDTMNVYFNTEMDAGYPNVQALIKEIKSLPGVKEYIAQRETYTSPIAK